MSNIDSDTERRLNWLPLLVLSIVIAAFAVVGALMLGVPPGRGFLSNLGKILALWLLGAANIVCLLLNLAYLLLTRRRARTASRPGAGRTWLWVIVSLQLAPALYFGAILINESVDRHRENRAYGQAAEIRQAIERDDLDAFAQAEGKCAQRCQELFSRESHLLEAARSRTHAVAQHLLSQGVKVSARLGAPAIDMRTCEDHYLPSMSTLAVAVANDDGKMLGLLLPASDEIARRDALWTAAELGRLELLQMMEEEGLPLTVRGRILDENATLLVAAASGAALRTGGWLIERGMPVHALEGPDTYPGQSPFSALMHFAQRTDSPRTAPFLRLLLQHGADVDEPRRDGLTWLQEAVRIRNKAMVRMLLDAGASRGVLTSEQVEELDALLAGPDRERWPHDLDGCVPVS